jgi:hypothetical protein
MRFQLPYAGGSKINIIWSCSNKTAVANDNTSANDRLEGEKVDIGSLHYHEAGKGSLELLL